MYVTSSNRNYSIHVVKNENMKLPDTKCALQSSTVQLWYLISTVVKKMAKAEFHPLTGHESPERKQRCSSTLPLTSLLDKGGWSRPRPSHSLCLGIPSTHCTGDRVGSTAGLDRCGKSCPPPVGFDSQTIQPVAICHTHYAIPAHAHLKNGKQNNLYF